jgi:hypothetical protein
MAEAAAQRMARQKGRIRKSGVLQEPLAGGFLAREQGESASLDDASIYARGLVPQGFLTSLMQFYWCSDPLFDIDHRPDLGPSMVDVRIGKSSGLLIFQFSTPRCSLARPTFPFPPIFCQAYPTKKATEPF